MNTKTTRLVKETFFVKFVYSSWYENIVFTKMCTKLNTLDYKNIFSFHNNVH